jgi:two-component system nitrogen regulation response regulator GlnG
MAKLLVVDDEPLICQSFQWVIGTHDVEVVTAGTVGEGWRRFLEDHPDVIVLDYQLPDGNGLELFDQIRTADPRRPVIFLTARGTTETAIEVMKRGAFDYLDKPFDLDQMDGLLNRAFEAARLMREPEPRPDEVSVDRIVGRSSLIREVCKQIGRVAPLDVTVLILGESGTGKELVARAIHQHSKRTAHRFLAINCAAIPEALVEAELFGNEAGAYTSAAEKRIGRFEQADGGTLFLDEIGDMPLGVQAKVLRFLQDRTFERLGGRESITSDCRILAATNHDLDQLIAEGRFRSDLYYRLKEVSIRVPALCKRTEDIPDLSYHFLNQFARDTERDVVAIAPEVLELFQRYPWPGNVRELRSALKEAAIRATGRTIRVEGLPSSMLTFHGILPGSSADVALLEIGKMIQRMLDAGEENLYDKLSAMVERELITRVLRYTQGHLGHTCKRLGIDRKTLRNKLQGLNIAPDSKSFDSRSDGSGLP